jgi:hypothetical protein
MTQLQTQHTDMQEFCSSKLWEMVAKDKRTSADDLEAAIEELAKRRHYLAELEQLGKLHSQS